MKWEKMKGMLIGKNRQHMNLSNQPVPIIIM